MRLTSDNLKDNMESARNLFYIKDGETWVLGGGPEPDYKDVSLYDLVRRITELHGLDIITTDNEAMGDHLYDLLLDSVDTIEGVVALLYTAAWAFSELRERLKAYEDKIPFDRLDEAATLVKARDEGRVVVLPCKVGDTVFEIAKGLSIYNPGLHPYVHEHIATELDVFNWARRGDIGKTVFLTHAEAEAALQEGGTHETDSV